MGHHGGGLNMESKGKLVVGKLNRNGERSIGARCDAEVAWSLKDGRFSASGSVWKTNRSDVFWCGQIIDDLVKLFPTHQLLQRIHATWSEWHLNDLTAGSPRQMLWLAVNPQPSDYVTRVKALSDAGLNPDTEYMHNGQMYVYGSAWLTRELPEDVVNEILSWSKED
jgi:hypothetical protein